MAEKREPWEQEEEEDVNRGGGNSLMTVMSVRLLLLLRRNSPALFIRRLTDELQHVSKSSKSGCCRMRWGILIRVITSDALRLR